MSDFSQELSRLREDYQQHALDECEVGDNPFSFFEKWFQQAIKSEEKDSNAMVLSTLSEDGSPHSRVVLLKGLEDESFVFYTNYNSQKGKDLEAQPKAALLFHWKSLERQVRIEGWVEKVNEATATAYFHSRPKGSQVGAHASPQSEKIANRAWLEERFAALDAQFQNQEVPKPAHWGGYAVKPLKIEFWQGRSSRLHDRIVFERSNENEAWQISRLAP